jgi:hypothetical protein
MPAIIAPAIVLASGQLPDARPGRRARRAERPALGELRGQTDTANLSTTGSWQYYEVTK